MGRKPKEETPVFNRLEAVREARGLSRNELAVGADVHYQTIGYIERGEYSPSLSLALTIAKILHTDIAEIFSLQPFNKKRRYRNEPLIDDVLHRTINDSLHRIGHRCAARNFYPNNLDLQ